jgi:hypothetical protein
VRAGVVGAAAFGLMLLPLAAAPGLAQTPPSALQTSAAPPPLPGFVPPYEITKIVRSAGFSPLAPPRREGTTYVLRATDFRGILMRVVVDARSGAIRAVNRIVPGPTVYGALGMMPPPYGEPPPYGPPPYYGSPPPYGAPPPYAALPAYAPSDIGGPEMGPEEADLEPPMGPPGLPPPSSFGHSSSLQVFPTSPPLPRPRPPELASREAPPAAKPAAAPAAKTDTAPNAAVAAPPAAAPVPPKKSQQSPIPD